MIRPAALDRLLWRIPTDLPPHAETRTVETDGCRLRVRDTGPGRPGLVFICDPPNTVEHYDGLIAELGDRYRLLILELPGFGFSRPGDADAVTFAGAVAAVESALTTLAPGPVVLCGPCVGGFVAAAVARRGRTPVAGLVLVQTPDTEGMRAWTERMDARGHLRRPWLGQLLVRLTAKRLAAFWYRYAVGRDTDPQPLADIATAALDRGGAYPLATMLQLWSRDMTDQPVACPTLALWGEQDRSHKHTDRESSRRHAPDAALHRFENCGHFPDLEDPARFAATVRPFLDRCLGPRPDAG